MQTIDAIDVKLSAILAQSHQLATEEKALTAQRRELIEQLECEQCKNFASLTAEQKAEAAKRLKDKKNAGTHCQHLAKELGISQSHAWALRPR